MAAHVCTLATCGREHKQSRRVCTDVNSDLSANGHSFGKRSDDELEQRTKLYDKLNMSYQ